MVPHQSQQLHPPQPESGLTEYLCAEGSQASRTVSSEMELKGLIYFKGKDISEPYK